MTNQQARRRRPRAIATLLGIVAAVAVAAGAINGQTAEQSPPAPTVQPNTATYPTPGSSSYSEPYDPYPYTEPYQPDPYDAHDIPTDSYETPYNSYDPDPGCAYPGDYLCDDTPVTVPPLDLGQNSW
jgi:hypothetical protein